MHLGQEDLETADMKGYPQGPAFCVGVSTHDHAELERAMSSFDPDYVALGSDLSASEPDAMEAAGLDRVGEWKKLVGARPSGGDRRADDRAREIPCARRRLILPRS